MSSTRSYLLPHEQEAVAREIDALLQVHKKQTQVARVLGVSQAAIWKAKQYRVVGPDVTRKVERHVGASVDDLVRKHGLAPPPPAAAMTPLDVAVVYLDDLIGPEAVRRVRARSAGRDMRPYEWGRELLAEQDALIKDRAGLGTPVSAPASALVKRKA